MKRKRFMFNIFAIVIFLLASVSTIAWYIKTGRIYELSDFSFHASRVQQIFCNLKQGHFFYFYSNKCFPANRRSYVFILSINLSLHLGIPFISF